jgi:ArsR family transcriptional regulator
LEILTLLLRHGELCVCEIEGLLEVSQSTASRHLRYLLNAGLVEDRREGLWVYYRVADRDDPHHQELSSFLRALLEDAPLPDLSREIEAMRADRCAPVVGP